MCTYHLQIILIKVFGNLEIRGTPQRVPALKEHKPSHQELATIAFMVRKEKKEMIKTSNLHLIWTGILYSRLNLKLHLQWQHYFYRCQIPFCH